MKKFSIQENRLMIHEWLMCHPECIKLLETLAKTCDETLRNQAFQLIADYWRWEGYPKDDPFNDSSEEANHIATHLICYFQFIKGKRRELPSCEQIPVTRSYLKAYKLTHSPRKRKPLDTTLIPGEYWYFLPTEN